MNDRSFTINNLQKHKPQGMDYKLKIVPLKTHLEAILGRLEGEVGEIKTSVETYNEEHPNDNIGFFSMVRVLTPIIEATATALGKEPQVLLEELRISSPYLRWTLYRDIFLHNDEMAFAAISQTKQGAAPGVIFTDENQTEIEELVASTGTLFDPMGIYRKLVSYIKSETEATNDEKTTQIIEAILLDATNEGHPEIPKIVAEIQASFN